MSDLRRRWGLDGDWEEGGDAVEDKLSTDIQIVELEDGLHPDNTLPNSFAIYIKLNAEPRLVWQDEFEKQLKMESRRRVVTFPGAKMRVVVTHRDTLDTLFQLLRRLVDRTNRKLRNKWAWPEA